VLTPAAMSMLSDRLPPQRHGLSVRLNLGGVAVHLFAPDRIARGVPKVLL
jgi:hypothetical protein